MGDVFVPTYLYIKRHKHTGMKYLGKTVKNPLFYKGSGKYWLRHLSKHGNDVETIWHNLYESKEDLTNAALHLSIENDVVNSLEWANHKPENGLDGALPGELHHMYGIKGEAHPRYGTYHTQETRQKMKDNHADFSGKNHPLFGVGHTDESRQKMRDHHADVTGANNPSHGKYWWTNGETTVKSSECPPGYCRGMGPMYKRHKKNN